MRLLGGVLAILHRAGSGLRVSVLLVLSASFALAACQSTGKTGGAVTQTPGQAQAAYYDCLETAARTPVLAAGGQHITATRLMDRCSGELDEWEDALIASGIPADEADAITDGVRDRIREQITGRFRRIN